MLLFFHFFLIWLLNMAMAIRVHASACVWMCGHQFLSRFNIDVVILTWTKLNKSFQYLTNWTGQPYKHKMKLDLIHPCTLVEEWPINNNWYAYHFPLQFLHVVSDHFWNFKTTKNSLKLGQKIYGQARFPLVVFYLLNFAYLRKKWFQIRQ